MVESAPENARILADDRVLGIRKLQWIRWWKKTEINISKQKSSSIRSLCQYQVKQATGISDWFHNNF